MARWLTNAFSHDATDVQKRLLAGQPLKPLSVGLPRAANERDQQILNAQNIVGIYEWITAEGRHRGHTPDDEK